MLSISKRIKDLRKKVGLSQEAAAKAMGISRPALGSYEEGRAMPSIITCVEICKLYGITPNDLLADKFDLRKSAVKPHAINRKIAFLAKEIQKLTGCKG